MKIFNTSAEMAISRPRPGQNLKTRGLDALLDGGNAEYYVQTLADYGGVAPDEESVDISCANGNVAIKLSSEVIPQGFIGMYSGLVEDIPEGWNQCDGLNGTPDLRNQFVVGAGGTYTLGDSGGSVNSAYPATTNGHALTVEEMPVHGHKLWTQQQTTDSAQNAPLYPTSGIAGEADGAKAFTGSQTADDLVETTGGDQAHSHTLDGSVGIGANLPPYYALMYIMKTGVVGQVIQPIRPEGLARYIGVSGVVELDAVSGGITVFEVQPNADITNLSVINLPPESTTAYGCAIKIISDGVSEIIWDGQFNFPSNEEPTLSTVSGNWDWVAAFSVDGGTVLDAELSIGQLD